MMRIKNVQTLDGGTLDIEGVGPSKTIDGSHLLALPALIDPHVHFRVPGGEHKEDWKTAARAAIRGGITTVCDMPNNNPPCTTLERLESKISLIDSQLQEAEIPLRYALYFGADEHHFDQIEKVAHLCPALKIFMGCSTGGLVVDSDAALEVAFEKATRANMLVAVHAEDEHILNREKKKYSGSLNPADHSRMRPKEAAIAATEKAIALAAKYKTRLYILHLSTKEEIALVAQAKKRGLSVFAEATTHHLFFNTEAYQKWGTLVQMNPPIRGEEDRLALWDAIRDGTIDTIGTDHAPHTLAEKKLPFGKAPSGIPGVDTLLPLMLDAVSKGQLTLARLIELTRKNPESIFALPPHDDLVLVDLEKEKAVATNDCATKCNWTPYEGKILKGWPVYTILKGKILERAVFAPPAN